MNTKRLSTTIQSFLANLVKGREVLDVGCVDHDAALEKTDQWLHKHLVQSASSVLGLDIMEDEAAKLRQRGYNVVAGDATSVSIGRQFDFVIAGEIVEHIDNPGAFIRNMAAHLKPEGKLVMTTPHSFFLMHFIESVLYNPRDRWNYQHVAWYCPFTLSNMFERCGLKVEDCYYFTRSRKLQKLMRTFGIPCYGWLASSIVLIARRA